MAFDTVSEMFWPADEGPLFDVDGTLAVAAIDVGRAVPGRLDHRGLGRAAATARGGCARRLRVELPPGYYSKEVKPYGLGDAILDDAGVLLVTMSCRWGLVYDTNEKRMVSCSHRSRSNPWNAAYRESLITT
uniref:Uncharacterized protein n=1 Tax=Oryza punctata TaxID=4537 RepID=A0A0E0JV46_ORYPU